VARTQAGFKRAPSHVFVRQGERRLSDPAPSAAREGALGRAAFARFVPKTTRWSDNDPYGHLNNVVYYHLFDAAVNALLIEAGLLDPASSPIIGLVVESNCRFFSSLSFPDAVEVGVAVENLGRSSVRYLLAVFKAGAEIASAQGRYTHVYVERASGRPTPIPEGHRRLMKSWIRQ
jgi:acyl-CoA thioester hydrolase